MKMLVLAWESVFKETIINYFSKASISKNQQRADVNDHDDPFKVLTDYRGNQKFESQKKQIQGHIISDYEFFLPILNFFFFFFFGHTEKFYPKFYNICSEAKDLDVENL